MIKMKFLLAFFLASYIVLAILLIILFFLNELDVFHFHNRVLYRFHAFIEWIKRKT